MLPEVSTQNMTSDSSAPEQLLPVVDGAGVIMYVTSGNVDISPGKISTLLTVPQKSHGQNWTTNN